MLTSRGTFQKYFTQAELGEYIGQELGRAPVPIAPGIYFVFRSDEDEQAFLVSKQSSRLRPMARCEARRRHRERKPSRPVRPRDTRWAQHSELLEAFWDAWLEFGRPLKHGEYSREGELREKLGTPNRVMRYLRTERGEDDLQVAAEARRADLLVYLALNLFARRRSFYGLSDRLQRDVKWFFGSYAEATAGAKRLLFSIADTRAIHAECVRAAGDGLGWLDGQHSLQLDSRLINDLPPILRVYVGCAAILYGDPEEADLVKIHIQSGKLTLLLYDDYLGEPTPKLIERVKINLRRRTLRFYEYGGRWPSAPLLLKSRFMNESCPEYASQMAFDQRWRELQRGAADV